MVFNTLYQSFLSLDPVIIIAIVATIVSIGITLVQKYLSNQPKIKRLKKDIDELRQEMKDTKDDPDEMMEVQSKMTSKNLAMMKEKFKPMIYYLVPVMLIFLWLGSTLAYQPIQPGQEFNVTLEMNDDVDIQTVTLETPQPIQVRQDQRNMEENTITWYLEGEEGSHTLIIRGDDFEETKNVVISEGRNYAEPAQQIDNGTITIGNKAVHPFGSFSLFGYRPGWLVSYIFFSIITGIIARKVMNVA